MDNVIDDEDYDMFLQIAELCQFDINKIARYQGIRIIDVHNKIVFYDLAKKFSEPIVDIVEYNVNNSKPVAGLCGERFSHCQREYGLYKNWVTDVNNQDKIITFPRVIFNEALQIAIRDGVKYAMKLFTYKITKKKHSNNKFIVNDRQYELLEHFMNSNVQLQPNKSVVNEQLLALTLLNANNYREWKNEATS